MNSLDIFTTLLLITVIIREEPPFYPQDPPTNSPYISLTNYLKEFIDFSLVVILSILFTLLLMMD